MAETPVNIRRFQIPGMTNDDNIDFFSPQVDLDNQNSPNILQEMIGAFMQPKVELNYPRKVQVLQAEFLTEAPADFHGLATDYTSAELGMNAHYLAVTAHDDFVDSDLPIPDVSVPEADMSAGDKICLIALRNRRFFKRITSGITMPPIGSWIDIDYADRANKRTGLIVGDIPDAEGAMPAAGSGASNSAANAHNQPGVPSVPLGAVNGILEGPVQKNAALCPDTAEEYSRLAELAETVGIELAVLLAVRSVESGPLGPAVVRFEPHWFTGRSNITGRPDLKPQIPYTPRQGTVVDYTAAHTNKGAFSFAYSLDPMVAIQSTSWGSYQVMGDNCKYCIDPTLKQALNNTTGAQGFIDYFNADPVTVSDEMLVAWFIKNPAAKTKANNLDWTGFANIYNGSGCCGPGTHQYDVKLQTAYTQAVECLNSMDAMGASPGEPPAY